MELYTFIGPSGSGKTSLSKWCMTLTPGDVHWISSDEIRKELFGEDLREVQTSELNLQVFTEFYKRMDKAMDGSPVIADATNLRSDSRKRGVELAKKHGYDPIAFMFPGSLEMLIARQEERKPFEQVPREAVERHLRQFDAITEAKLLDEGFSKVIDGTDLLNRVRDLHQALAG